MASPVNSTKHLKNLHQSFKFSPQNNKIWQTIIQLIL